MSGGLMSNYVVNATVRPFTPLAAASGAPVRPARYHGRYTDTGTMNHQRPCPGLLVGGAQFQQGTRTPEKTSASVIRCHARGPAFPQATRSLSTLGVRRVATERGAPRAAGWLLPRLGFAASAEWAHHPDGKAL